MMPKSRYRRRATRLLTAFAALLILGLTAIAQEQSQYDRGTPPQHTAGVSSLGSYTSADIGTINLSNGSLNFKLPLGSVGGRGFWLPLTLNYSNKLWSGRRSQVFISDPAPGHMEAAAWAAYNDYTADIYNAVAPGWTVGAAPFLKARGQGINSNNNPNGCTDFSWALVKLTLTLPDRGEVESRDDQRAGAPMTAQTFGPTGCRTQDGYRGKRWHATDGSGTVFISDNDNGVVNGDLAGKVITADGTRYHFVNASSGNVGGSAYLNNIARCDWVRDRNGNKVSIDYPTGSKVVYTDQLGRQTIVEFSVSDSQFPGETLALRVTLPGYNGSLRYYKVRSGVMNLNYRSDDNPVLPVYNGAYPTGVIGTELFAASYEAGMERIDDKQVLTQLVLPDSRALTFKYNRFGEVAEVQLPTGGKVQYDYVSVPLDTPNGNGLPSGNSLAAEVIASGQQAGGNVRAVDRAVVARRTYPDGSTLEGTWSYSYKITKTRAKCTSGGITLLDEWHYFLLAQRFLTGSTSTGADGTGYSLWSTGIERRSEMVDTNGTTVLSAAEQDWGQRASVSWSTGYTIEQVANDNRVAEQRKYLDDGSMSKTDIFYDPTIAASNHINNPSDVYEYDFDQTLKRRSTTSYLILTPYTSTGVNTVNILSLPLQQSVYDGGGAELARTTYEYDNYAADGNHAALQSYTPDAYNHDSGYGFGYTTRGNATQITRMVNASTFTSAFPRYDTLGNVVSTKDPRTNITTISYLDDFGNGAGPGFGGSGSFGPTYSLPTLITSPPPNPTEPQQTARSQYDFSTGLLTGFKDRNGTITQTLYNDLFDRPTQIKSALGTPLENHTVMYYAGLNPLTVFGVTLTNNDMLTAKDQSGIDDGNLRSWTKTDGFGRTLDSFARDPQGDVRTTATYDGLGRAKRITNPYRTTNDPTYGYTDTTFDLLGRVTRVETFSGSGVSAGAVTTAYSGNQVTVTDQALKVRRSVTDGLGRLKQVIEDPNLLAYSTNYTYDALDDLTSVIQNVQTRTFAYDGLKRLTQAFNPESGTVNYTYDANSNLETKLDARLITTTYAYDALNRVKSRMYENDPQSTPAVSYKYDAQALQAGSPPSFDRGSSVGRLVAVTYGGESSGTYRGYDQLGRVVRQVQQTDGIDYAVDATYDLAGEAKTETYPAVPGFADRRTVSFNYDTAGRMNSISSAATSYAAAAGVSSMTYSPHGGLATETYGSGLVHAMTYNPRLQPDHIKLGTAAAPASILDLEYTYSNSNPNIHDNNGNVRTQKVTAGAFFLTQTYTYDGLNRLGSASEKVGSETNPRWSQSYGYDRFGNRTSLINSGSEANLLPTQSTPAIDSATNRLVGFHYDAAGNLAQADFVTRYYDAENRMVRIGKTLPSYQYDGEGRRVSKRLQGPQSGTTVYYVYDIAGVLVADYTFGGFGSSSQEYVYGASGLVATIQRGNATATYLTADHLGSPRVATNNSQAVVSRHDYLPFGEELSVGIGGRTAGMGYGGIDGVRQKFTQKERDNESGLDYFLARYYSSAQGRFTSPDEFVGGPDELFDFSGAASSNPTFYADLTDPQSLNKYQYCYNNPLLYIDPDGHQGIKKWIQDTLRGAAATFNADNGLPAPSGDQTTTGRTIGHLAAITQGVTEVVTGGNMIVGGGTEAVVTSPAATTVVGAVVPAAGVGVAVVGGALVVHGGGVLINTTVNIFKKGDTTASNSQQQSQPQQSQPGPTTEVTPRTNSKAFEAVKGSPAKRNKESGEIWVKDRLHKDHYEVYKNQKKFENGKRNRSVWEDGRAKEKF
ncbi:MAG: RHS repeat-associated core domain-containing protein [Acidobacteriota bacterium]